MNRYVVYGAGTPIPVQACSSEHAEAIVCDRYKVPVDNIVALKV